MSSPDPLVPANSQPPSVAESADRAPKAAGLSTSETVESEGITRQPEPASLPSEVDQFKQALQDAEGRRMYLLKKSRAPRIGRVVLLFMTLGAIALLALGLHEGDMDSTDILYFALVGAVVGGVIGSVVALILERIARGR